MAFVAVNLFSIVFFVVAFVRRRMELKRRESPKGLIGRNLKTDLLTSIKKFDVFQTENYQRLEPQNNTLKLSGIRGRVRTEERLLSNFVRGLRAE